MLDVCFIIIMSKFHPEDGIFSKNDRALALGNNQAADQFCSTVRFPSWQWYHRPGHGVFTLLHLHAVSLRASTSSSSHVDNTEGFLGSFCRMDSLHTSCTLLLHFSLICKELCIFNINLTSKSPLAMIPQLLQDQKWHGIFGVLAVEMFVCSSCRAFMLPKQTTHKFTSHGSSEI